MKATLNLWGFEKEIEVSTECFTVKVPMARMPGIPGACGILFAWDGESGAVRRFRFEGFLYPTGTVSLNEVRKIGGRRWGRRKGDVTPADWGRDRQGS